MPNFSIYIIGFFAAVIFGYIFILSFENRELKSKLTIAQKEIDSYQKNLNAAYDAISTQNKAVEDMKNLSDFQEQKLKAALDKSSVIQKDSQKQYESILNSSVSSKCDDALNWGIDRAKKLINNP